MKHRRLISIEKPGRAAALCTMTLGALALAACSASTDPGTDTAGSGGSVASAGVGGSSAGGTSGNGGMGGTLVIGATGGGGGIAGAPSLSGGTTGGGMGGTPPYLSPESGLENPTVTPTTAACSPSDPLGPFCDQVVWNVSPARRVLYSWTTAEQAEELRRDRILLTRTETAGLGRGYAFTSIDELAARGTAPENQLLTKLSGELFTKVRYAWPNAWATRMGWPGEDYGDQLLKIVLKTEAWIVVVSDTVGIAVIDMDNNLVPIADALAHSERIGAVYFYKKDITGSGTFRECSGGYREFIVGNEAMIEEWSLGTEEIRAQLAKDADLIADFLTVMRGQTPPSTPEEFNAYAVCQWDNPGSDELAGYVRSLSIPSEYYAPQAAELAALGDMLQQSLFEPDPLVVTPGD